MLRISLILIGIAAFSRSQFPGLIPYTFPTIPTNIPSTIPTSIPTMSTMLINEGKTFSCRPGFNGNPLDKYTLKFSECESRLKLENYTVECVRTCVWNDFQWVNTKTRRLNRTAIFNHEATNATYPKAADRELYCNDMEYCWNHTRPSFHYDGQGCKTNVAFTICFADVTEKACHPNSTAPQQTGLKLQ